MDVPLVGEDVRRHWRLFGAVPFVFAFLWYDGRTLRAMQNRGEIERVETARGTIWWLLREGGG